MKKKSTSDAVFFNLRVLVGFNVFLVGVFLALFAVAKPSGGKQAGFAAATGASPAGSGGTILFNQLTGVTTGFVPAQRLVPPSPFDAEGADDVMVFDAEGWTIGQFNFDIFVVGSEPIVDVRVYPTTTAGLESRRCVQLRRACRQGARRCADRRRRRTATGSVASPMCARPAPLLGVPRAERRFGDAMGRGNA
jgi:hypothetical protein